MSDMPVHRHEIGWRRNEDGPGSVILWMVWFKNHLAYMLEERIFDGVENTQIETSQPGDTGKKPIDVEMYASLIKIETLNLSEDALRGRLSGGGSVCWAYNKENFSLKIWYRTSDF